MKKIKKILSVILVIIMFTGTLSIAASAASYSNGTYKVTAFNGVNVRRGSSTRYSIVGAAKKNTTFTVTSVSGSWGYTKSIRCTNGTRSGWVCLQYCSKQSGGSSNSNRSTYNDVFASVKGSGCTLSQARNSESTSFAKGTFVYVWAWFHDANSNLLKSYFSGTCNMKLSIYRPNGSCAYSYTYNDSDCNWIGQRLDTVGTWKIQSTISGALTGTNTRTITVTDSSSSKTLYPSSVSLNYSSISMDVGVSRTLSATVYPSNASNKSITWESSNSSVAVVSNGRVRAKGVGSATIYAVTCNGKTAACSVKVKGVKINSIYNTVYVGDTYYLSATSCGVSSSYKWSSSNSSVASVNSSGKMTIKSAGSAIITVRTSDGYTATEYIYAYSKNIWKTGNFDSGYTAQNYTTVTLNKNAGTAKIKITTYDMLGWKSGGQMHVTLRSDTGAWIWEGDISSGTTLNLGNDHSSYRVYIAKKRYSDNIIGNSDSFINTGKCVSWSIQCTKNCYI